MWLPGGMHGCCRGACMVVGGVCGCGVCVWLRGACVVVGGMHRIGQDMVNEGRYAFYWNEFLLVHVSSPIEDSVVISDE